MELEYLIKIIKESGAEILNEDSIGEIDYDLYLIRTIEFKAIGKVYEIVWFKNVCTLYVDNMQIIFDDVTTDNTWPIHPFESGMNLNLRYGGTTICAIPTKARK